MQRPVISVDVLKTLFFSKSVYVLTEEEYKNPRTHEALKDFSEGEYLAYMSREKSGVVVCFLCKNYRLRYFQGFDKVYASLECLKNSKEPFYWVSPYTGKEIRFKKTLKIEYTLLEDYDPFTYYVWRRRTY